ncbi:MAG: 30S ribosomal protein S16 [Chitinophagaceae bacterium]|nr:30S ribosomal protein S16 [Chitinophagaceae bacterium]
MVKIRLARRGRRNLAMFDIVVANSNSPQQGKFIEKIGTYNPNTNPATIVINEEKALKWLSNGAQPTETIRAILSYKGILYKRHLQIGVDKKAITQENADAKYIEWKNKKDEKIASKIASIRNKKEIKKKQTIEIETKKKLTRIETIKQKNTPKQ